MNKKLIFCTLVLSLMLSVVSFAAYGDIIAETSSEGWDLALSSSPGNNGSYRTDAIAYSGKNSICVPVGQKAPGESIRIMLKSADFTSNVYIEAAVYGVNCDSKNVKLFTIDTENNIKYFLPANIKIDGNWTLFGAVATAKTSDIYQAGIEYTKGENDNFDVIYIDDITVRKIPEKIFITDIATYYDKPLCLNDVNIIGADLSGKTEKCSNALVKFSTDSPGFVIKNGNLINYDNQPEAIVNAEFFGIKTSFKVKYAEMYSFSVNNENTQATMTNFTDKELTVKIVTTVYENGVLKNVYSKNITAGKNQTVNTAIKYEIAPWYKNVSVKTFCIN